MIAKMRRNFSGVFAATDCGKGVWRIAQSQPNSIDIFLRGIDAWHGKVFAAPPLSDLAIEWRDGRAFLSMISAGVPSNAEALCALVHEPLPDLYQSLPLAKFDARARRFWWRVFLLVRIPGGRLLLRLIARSSRKRG